MKVENRVCICKWNIFLCQLIKYQQNKQILIQQACLDV